MSNLAKLIVFSFAFTLECRGMDKKYYAVRVGVKVEPYDFDTLKAVFLLKFEELERSLFFQEATGYKCVDLEQVVHGIWGGQPRIFLFHEIKISGFVANSPKHRKL
jgi:hypothetical protein